MPEPSHSADVVMPSRLPPQADRVSSTQFALLLLVASIVCLCVPLWTLSHFPTQDGPAHLNTSFVIAWYGRVPLFASAFRLYFQPAGNMLYDLLCAATIRLLGPMLAERVLLTAYIVLWPLAVWCAVKPLSRYPVLIAVGALPLGCNYFFNMGFWPYCYGVIFALFAFGAYLRSRSGEISAIWFVVLALATFFFHVVAFGWLAVTVLLLASREFLSARQNAVRTGPGLRPLLLLAAGILVPAALFLGWFLFKSDESFASGPGLLLRLRSFVFMTYAAGYGDHEVVWLAAFLLAFGSWILLGCRKRLRTGSHPMDALLWAGAVFAASSLVLPDAFGDASYIVLRLIMLAWLCVLLWLASLPWSARALTFVAVVGALLCFGQVVVRYPAYARYARHMDSIDRLATRIPPGASFASRLVSNSKDRVIPTMHADDLIALRPALNLTLYQARTTHFMIAYRAGVSANQATYLLLERRTPRPLSGAGPLSGQIPAGYQLLATSDDRYTDLYIATR